MPNVGVIDLSSDEPGPIESFFTKLGKDYRDKQDQLEIGNILNQYQQNRNNENAWEDAYIQAQTSNKLSPTKRIELMNQLGEMSKVITERKKAFNDNLKNMQEQAEKTQKAEKQKESIYELYKRYMPEEEARRLSEIDDLPTARARIKPFQDKDKPAAKSEFEKTLEREEAKKLVKLEEDIPKAKDALANLDRIDELATKELSGIKGYGKALFNTESAKEMENLSFTSIEPIVKLFNPVGPIPVAKLEMIRNQFQAHPSDLSTTIRGKNAALRRIGQQAVARAEQRASLIRKYKGQPPPEEISNFDRESSHLQDVLVDQETFNIKFEKAKDDDLIEGLYSAKDGRKLKPIPKKEAKKLYEQGLITNVPPD